MVDSALMPPAETPMTTASIGAAVGPVTGLLTGMAATRVVRLCGRRMGGEVMTVPAFDTGARRARIRKSRRHAAKNARSPWTPGPEILCAAAIRRTGLWPGPG